MTAALVLMILQPHPPHFSPIPSLQPHPPVQCTPVLIMPAFRKPVPLSRVVLANKAAAATAAAAACPPITGVNCNFLTYSNSFDDSGAFRGRSGSGAKRPRTESEAERDAIYDLSRLPPPPHLSG